MVDPATPDSFPGDAPRKIRLRNSHSGRYSVHMFLTNRFVHNRPIHLARRDVYFEHAVDQVQAQRHNIGEPLKPGVYNDILFLLHVVCQHARFCVRSLGQNENDERFCHFAALLVDNVKAVLSMLELYDLVQQNGSSVFGFPGSNQALARQQAEEYQSRANDIVRTIVNTLDMSRGAFEQLKRENAESLKALEIERYAKSREHFERLIGEGRHRYTIASGFSRPHQP